MEKIIEHSHHIYTILITCVTTMLGEHWILFCIFLLLNIIDTFTGWAKAKITNTESSLVGLIGVIKKICYWLLILIAFFIPVSLQEIGNIIHLDLSVTIFLGWFVLASLIINEYRSIIENLVTAGCKVPKILSYGLEVAANTLESMDNQNE